MSPFWRRPRDAQLRVLILGQTPPPVHGQGLMIELLLKHPIEGVEFSHVRMAYSKRIDEVGKLRLGKVGHLASVVGRAATKLVLERPDILYYPPSGPSLVPVVRDALTLLALRPLAPWTVFHFHAGGLSELWERKLSRGPWAAVFRRALFGVDAAVLLARGNPPDGQVLEAKRVYYVPYGIPDAAPTEAQRRPLTGGRPRVLFVGAVFESKGVLTLAEACAQLWEAGQDFELMLVGSCTPEMAASLRERVGGFSERLLLPGVLVGTEKWDAYRSASLFCFPSYYEAETFGVVCLEAMMFGLPIVAARWRGIADVIDEGVTGTLVPPRDAPALAGALRTLLADPAARERLGRRGRERYEAHFTLARYLEGMRRVFFEVAGGKTPAGDA